MVARTSDASTVLIPTVEHRVAANHSKPVRQRLTTLETFLVSFDHIIVFFAMQLTMIFVLLV